MLMNDKMRYHSLMTSASLLIASEKEVDALVEQVHAAARHLQVRLLGVGGDGLDLLRVLKFNPVGRHPLVDRPLNAIEQVNQTWTYLVAFAAVRKLLALHPEAGGFRIAPGAHAAQALDVMSVQEGLVGAETFAAVDPSNNQKIKADLTKLAQRTEQHRYVFFKSPRYPGNQRITALEQDGIQVWSVDV